MNARTAIQALPAPVTQGTKDAALRVVDMWEKNSGGTGDEMVASAGVGDAVRLVIAGELYVVEMRVAARQL